MRGLPRTNKEAVWLNEWAWVGAEGEEVGDISRYTAGRKNLDFWQNALGVVKGR